MFWRERSEHIKTLIQILIEEMLPYYFTPLIPAQAGIYSVEPNISLQEIPAYAGMSGR